MTEAVHRDDAETVFDQLVREDTDRRMHYGALYYAKHGIPVFPIKMVVDSKNKTIKKPAISNWVNDATTDIDIINNWWGSGGTHEGYLIGAVTGNRSGWGVIDVDIKNGGKGLESLQRLADEVMPLKTTAEFAFGQLLPQERLDPVGLAKTRSGGLHLWYPLGERRTISGRKKIKDLPNIEFQATGQYVVVAPSDGYEWLKLLPMKRQWEMPTSEYLATLPVIDDRLLDRLLQGGGGDGYGTDGVLTDLDGNEINIVARGGGKSSLSTAVVTLINTPEGNGNNTVWGLCCDLYPYVVLGELPKIEVDTAIKAGVRNWGADERSIEATMRSAWQTTNRRVNKFNDEIWPAAATATAGSEEMHVPAALVAWAQDQVPPDHAPIKPTLTLVTDDDDDKMSSSSSPEKPAVEPATDDECHVDVDEPLESLEISDDAEDHDLSTLVDKTSKDWYKELQSGLRARVLRADIDELYRLYSGQSNKASWMPVDVSSTADVPDPRLLTMDNGRGLMYAGEINMVWGLASAGKTWLENLLILQEVRAGRHVVLIDYENGKAKIRYRLQVVGLTSEEINKYVHVVISPSGAFPVRSFPIPMDKIGAMIVDSMTGALRSLDLDSRRGDDVETYVRNNVRPFTEAGVGVLIIDHVAKSEEQHDRPINSVHKLNRVQGAAYQLKIDDPFVPGRRGSSILSLWKDNAGGVGPGVSENVGRLVIDSPGPDQPVKIWIDPDVKSMASLSTTASATERRIQELVDQLDDLGLDDTASQRECIAACKKRGVRYSAAALGLAMKIRKARRSA